MTGTVSSLQAKLNAGKQVIISELQPPAGYDPAALLSVCEQYRTRVDAVGLSDNRDTITMSALAAASLVLNAGLEPVLHLTTRDRNRIALVSEVLGARALGISNLLVTSGTHQSLGDFASAKSVYDIDTVQLLAMLNRSDSEAFFPAADLFLTGAVANPNAEPPAMQLIQTGKKVRAGARFLITRPVFDPAAFKIWWQTMLQEGLAEQTAVIAGIKILPDARTARALSQTSPEPGIPELLLQRLSSHADAQQQRAEGIKIALETCREILALEKIRGLEIYSGQDHAAVLEVIDALRKTGV